MDNVNYCKIPLPKTIKVVTVFLSENKIMFIANSNLSDRTIKNAMRKELRNNSVLLKKGRCDLNSAIIDKLS